MAVGVRPGATREVVVTGTTFLLRRLTAAQWLDVVEKGRDVDGKRRVTTAVVREAIAQALVGWRDFAESDGTPIPWPGSGDEAVDWLDAATFAELWVNIEGASTLTEPERKNSESPEASSPACSIGSGSARHA